MLDGNIKIHKQYIRLQEACSKRKKYTSTFCVLKYILNTFSQVHILLIVIRRAAQIQFGIMLNTTGYRLISCLTVYN